MLTREIFDLVLEKRIDKCIKEMNGAFTKEEMFYNVGWRVGALICVENKTLIEVLRIMTVKQILNDFPKCSNCGSYKGKIYSTSMNMEFDSGKDFFTCSNCGQMDLLN